MRSFDSLTIVCGQGGLNASESPDLVRDIDLVAMESLTVEHDTWEKGGGAVKFNSVAVTGPDPECRTMFDFRTQSGTQELVVATKTNRLLVVGSGGITKTLATFTGSSFIHPVLVEGFDGTLKAVYLFKGSGVPAVYTGGSTAMKLGSAVGNFTANSTTDVLTLNSHGMANGTRVFLTNSGGALPAGLSDAWANTNYFIVNQTANTFQLSTLSGGSAENFTSDGTGTHTVHRSTMPADWQDGAGNPRWAFQHRGRMFAGGVSAHPHSVYTTVLNNHNDYLSAGALYFEVYPGEGDLIVGGISWRNKAYVWKYPSGIYVLDDSSLDLADWGWTRVSRFAGGLSQGSIVEADDEVYFVSPDAYIHALSAVQEYGDVRSSAVKGFEVGPYIREHTDFSKIPVAAWSSWGLNPLPQAVYYPTKRKLLFAFSANPNVISQQGYPVNKVLIGFDMHRTNRSMGIVDIQPTVETRDEYESLTIYRDPTTADPVLLAGGSNGFIYRLDQSARTKDGAGYMSRFETKEFYLYQNGMQNANLRELEILFAPNSSNNSIVIKVYQDGTLENTKTLTDSVRKMRLYGSCYKIKIVGENDTNNSSFSVASISVRFMAGNMRKL